MNQCLRGESRNYGGQKLKCVFDTLEMPGRHLLINGFTWEEPVLEELTLECFKHS